MCYHTQKGMGISGLGRFPRADVVGVMEGKLDVLGAGKT